MDAAVAPVPSSERIDAVAHALADGTRRRLLRLVRDDERAAGDLATEFPGISRPAVSQHLRVLHDAGLVTIRPAGNHRYYQARREGLTEVWHFVEEMWADRLAKLKEVAEEAERPRRPRPQPKRRKR
jgi:DNA-binding transcriptional ArsR family regulator